METINSTDIPKVLSLKLVNSKRGIRYGHEVFSHCVVCGSSEYLHNENLEENRFCGQCGTKLDWNNMINEDYED